MKQTHKIIAGLVLAAGIGGVAIAQPGRGGCDGYGPMGMMGGMGPMAVPGGQTGRQAGAKFDPAQRAERHLAFVKSALKPTAEQEPLWNAYAEKMKSAAASGFATMHAQAADAKLTAPERMARMRALMEGRFAIMKDVHESFSRLYEALTPEQKAKADHFASGMGPGMRSGMGGRAGGSQGAPGGGLGRTPQHTP